MRLVDTPEAELRKVLCRGSKQGSGTGWVEGECQESSDRIAGEDSVGSVRRIILNSLVSSLSKHFYLLLICKNGRSQWAIQFHAAAGATVRTGIEG